MKRLALSILMMVTFALTLLGAAPASATESAKAGAMPPLPPGVTPAMFKMMMTPAGPMHPAGMPPGFQPLHGCIPTMGYHYWNPKIGLTGPLYGWYKGKLTFTEWMPTPKQLKATMFDDILRPLPGYKLDHVDIWPTRGHPSMMFPHYDIHAWYVSHDEHMKYCNPSGKHPAFMVTPLP